MNSNRYIYIYLDPRKPGRYSYGRHSFDYEPFYIGKGTGYRCRDHLFKFSGNRILYNKVQHIRKELKREPIIEKLYVDLTNEEAYKLEIELIDLVGRICLDTGPLTNFKKGGAGANIDRSSKTWTPEQRRKIMSKRAIKQPREGKTNSPSMRLKQSLAKQGKKLSEAHKQALRGRKFVDVHKNKLSQAKSKKLVGYDLDRNIVASFNNTLELVDTLSNWSQSKVYSYIKQEKPIDGIVYKRISKT